MKLQRANRRATIPRSASASAASSSAAARTCRHGRSDSYADLGATITGPQADLNLGIHTYLNDAPVNTIQIDTTQVATDTIQYVATDQTGLTATSKRTVIVRAPDSAAFPTVVINPNVATTSASAAATSTAQ
jgi:hypothetical protein